MNELLTIMRRLRAPEGCPWDQEQTHATLRPYLLEEAAEAADAISAGDLVELCGELGDVLLQVAFHSVIAEEAGDFSYYEVEQSIVDKLIRRHPHVFGGVRVANADEVISNWQSIKGQEQGGKPRSAADKIPRALGALLREQQAQKLSQANNGSTMLLEEALKQIVSNEQSVGQVLAAVVAWSRASGVDAETALRAYTNATLRELDAE